MSEFHPASDTPDNCRSVIMRFGDNGERDTEGFYWAAEGASNGPDVERQTRIRTSKIIGNSGSDATAIG